MLAGFFKGIRRNTGESQKVLGAARVRWGRQGYGPKRRSRAPIGGNGFRHVRGTPGCARSRRGAGNRGHGQPWRTVHQRCVRCENQSRPGRSGRPIERYERRGNRRRGTRLSGAAAAIDADGETGEAAGSRAQHAAGGSSGSVRTCAGTGARRSRHRRRTECAGDEPRRSPLPAQPARASEARNATSVARSAVARRTRRWSGQCRRTVHRP